MFIYCLVLCANQQIQSHKSMGLLIWESTANKCEITVWGINWRICEFWCYLFIYLFFTFISHCFFLFFLSLGYIDDKSVSWNGFVCFVFSFAEELEEEKENPTETELTEKQKHQLRHRELFLSRQYESLPATHIRYSAQRHTNTYRKWTVQLAN